MGRALEVEGGRFETYEHILLKYLNALKLQKFEKVNKKILIHTNIVTGEALGSANMTSMAKLGPTI